MRCNFRKLLVFISRINAHTFVKSLPYAEKNRVEQNCLENRTMTELRLLFHIECRELTNMDLLSKISPQVVLLDKEDGKWNEIGRTEVIPYEQDPNYNPKFEMPISVMYRFEGMLMTVFA